MVAHTWSACHSPTIADGAAALGEADGGAVEDPAEPEVLAMSVVQATIVSAITSKRTKVRSGSTSDVGAWQPTKDSFGRKKPAWRQSDWPDNRRDPQTIAFGGRGARVVGHLTAGTGLAGRRANPVGSHPIPR